MNITLEQARAVVSATLAYGQELEMNPLCVAVLDAGGHLKAFEREDGVANRRFEVAFGKAHGAISIGVSSRTLGDMAVERPHFIAGLIGTVGGSLVPVPGGVIIVDDGGNAIGAVGVSGDSSDNDEAAALAGIQAAGLSARS
ncbi:MAG: heme-binding protein [Acidimicrobiia bacterium]|nr:heme-binding protein [Acidimicrobiia bacterium]